MSKIKINPHRLDAEADEAFDLVKFYEENPTLAVKTDFIEHHTLAGIALRRWAVSMRRARKRAKRANEKAQTRSP